MATFSTSLIPSKIKKLISLKPFLLAPEDVEEAGQEINVVGYNPLAELISNAEKPFSPRLMNWVEPYLISGYFKTLFYTEVNSGLKVGDRVFIVNGNYDSDSLIKVDKYKKGRDGYKILFIDKCTIVLDIDYTGVLPWSESQNDDFVNVYYIRNGQDFHHANRNISTIGGTFGYKFDPYHNNIIYADSDYPAITGWGETLGLTGSPGFYVKNGTYSWTNITSAFISGSFSTALGLTYSFDKLKVHNATFTFSIGPGVAEFKEGYIYSWQMAPEPDAVAGTYSTWISDSSYNRPFITKANFRGGNFKGVWNTGLFGKSDKRITWEGVGSTWNNGTLLNTKWLQGTINSKYTLPESYVTEFDQYGLPFQKITGPDNNGKGYNYIVSSELVLSDIKNGNIIDCVIGTTPTYSLIENYITSATTSYPSQISQAMFEDCVFNGGFVSNAELKKVRAFNTFFNNVKSVNSSFKLSIIKDSTYLSDEVIKILGYDEFNYSVIPTGSPVFPIASHKVYKFYISKPSYDRLKIRDRFYFKGIKFNDNSKYPLNFFDKRFRVSSWTEYVDDISATYSFYKRGIEVGAFLSTPAENAYKYNTSIPGQTVIVSTNSNYNYSVDIVVSTHDKDSVAISGLDFNRGSSPSGTSSLTMSNFIANTIDISNAWILDSDFESGVFETSNWNNGYHINYNNDVNITTNTYEGGNYDITVVTQSHSLIVNTTYDQLFVEAGESCLSIGNIVYLNAIDYDTTGRIDSFTISTTGSSYSSVTGSTVSGGNGTGLIIDITENFGGLDIATISFGGLGYKVGDTLVVSGGNEDAQLIVLSITGSVTRLPDTYKITNRVLNTFTLEEIVTGSISVIEGLLTGGVSSTINAQNRYGYIYKSKFANSKIKAGLFKRGYFINSLIENEDYVISDREFDNLEKIRSLLISDSIFSNTNNILSKATYMNSHFVSGSDIQNNGIIFNSVWNGPTFSNGVFKQGRWVDGVFNGGTFYNSRSFDASATASYPYYYTDRAKNYWKDGPTDLILANDRYSWQKGTFNGGEFYKSDWESGEFKGGKLYYSKFYGGLISDGIIGEDSIPSTYTQVFSATVSYTTVENAVFYAKDTSYAQDVAQTISWKNGIFNDGVFGSDFEQQTQAPTYSVSPYSVISTFGTLAYDYTSINSNSGYLYVSDGSDIIEVYDTNNSNSLVTTITVTSSNISASCYNSTNDTLYFVDDAAGVIYVVDSNTNIVINSIVYAGGTTDILFIPSENCIYIAGSSNIYRIDCTTDTISVTALVSYRDLEYNSVNGLVYGSRYIQQIDVIDPSTDTIYQSITTTYFPSTVGINQNIFTPYFYVSDISTGDLNIYNWNLANTFVSIISPSIGLLSRSTYDSITNNVYFGTTTGNLLIVNGNNTYQTSFISASLLISLSLNQDTNSLYVTSPFTNTIIQLTTIGIIDMLQIDNSAIWYDGVFNNGQFISNGRWKNGIFNGGKFISGYGWTLSSSTYSTDYPWEDGTFNGGEFGNANTATNSNWFQGDFNGGVFKGRVWNDGVFTFGEFQGSGATYSASGGLSSSNASVFMNSFTSDYYGFWRKGYVTNQKDSFITDKKLFTEIISSKKPLFKKPLSYFKNMLWQSGTFSHPRVEMNNSIWLDGAFEKGIFVNSSFNPYVTRPGDSGPSFNLNDQTCYWENGNFDGGDFYISEWKDGKFIIGTAFGMIWKDGVSNYMNAFNIFWEDGLWRNGNWYGSYFSFDGDVDDGFARQILYRGMSWSNSQNCHLWNIFENTNDNSSSITSGTATYISGGFESEIVGPILAPFIPSDSSLKENLIKVSESESGINIYQFNYIGSSDIYIGVVAQELINTEFENAIHYQNGIYLVNYSLIDVEFKKLNI